MLVKDAGVSEAAECDFGGAGATYSEVTVWLPAAGCAAGLGMGVVSALSGYEGPDPIEPSPGLTW
jgi:hypothetical protein